MCRDVRNSDGTVELRTIGDLLDAGFVITDDDIMGKGSQVLPNRDSCLCPVNFVEVFERNNVYYRDDYFGYVLAPGTLERLAAERDQ